MVKGLMSFFFNTPILHHSSTPGPRLSRTFGIPKIIFLLVIVPLLFYDLNVQFGPLLRSQPGERPVNIIYLWDFLQCIGRLPSSFQP
jgi:hypothetical protein